MALSRKLLPLLLYFYQNDLTQAEADTVVSHFKDKDVHFRKVSDINDTRDMVERCAYAAGAVPLIYFVRKAEGVLTDGVLADPLERPNAAKPTSKGEDTEVVQKSEPLLSTGHVQPTDANISAKLLTEEIAQATAKNVVPSIKAADVVADKQVAPISSVTGQVTIQPTADETTAEATQPTPVAVAAPKKPTVPTAAVTKQP